MSDKIEAMRSTIAGLMAVRPKSFGNDKQCTEAVEWIALVKKTEDEADALLDAEIKEAHQEHKRLTTQKKGLIEKIVATKTWVRVNLANWIAGGHTLQGYYIKTTYKVTINDATKVPDEYAYRAINEEMLADWAKKTEGKVPIPGCTIEPVNVLYAKGAADEK